MVPDCRERRRSRPFSAGGRRVLYVNEGKSVINWRFRERAAACGIALLWLSAAVADAPPATPTADWTSSTAARIEALALLETLRAELLSHDSATLTLEQWCAAHRLASPPRILAARVPDVDKPVSPELRADLRVGPQEPVRYRRVRLLCGAVVLSEADNWYVPGRLTPDINRLLESTDVPFGRAAQPLHFQRRTLSSTLLWSPMPEGWDSAAGASKGAAVAPMPPLLLEHRALLALPDGTPISEVVESYTSNVLAFAVPEP
jgi:hypothetical protein